MARVAPPAPSAAMNALARWTLWAMAHDAPVVLVTRYGTRVGPVRITERDHGAVAKDGTTVRVRTAAGDWYHLADLQKITTDEG